MERLPVSLVCLNFVILGVFAQCPDILFSDVSKSLDDTPSSSDKIKTRSIDYFQNLKPQEYQFDDVEQAFKEAHAISESSKFLKRPNTKHQSAKSSQNSGYSGSSFSNDNQVGQNTPFKQAARIKFTSFSKPPYVTIFDPWFLPIPIPIPTPFQLPKEPVQFESDPTKQLVESEAIKNPNSFPEVELINKIPESLKITQEIVPEGSVQQTSYTIPLEQEIILPPSAIGNQLSDGPNFGYSVYQTQEGVPILEQLPQRLEPVIPQEILMPASQGIVSPSPPPPSFIPEFGVEPARGAYRSFPEIGLNQEINYPPQYRGCYEPIARESLSGEDLSSMKAAVQSLQSLSSSTLKRITQASFPEKSENLKSSVSPVGTIEALAPKPSKPIELQFPTVPELRTLITNPASKIPSQMPLNYENAPQSKSISVESVNSEVPAIHLPVVPKKFAFSSEEMKSTDQQEQAKMIAKTLDVTASSSSKGAVDKTDGEVSETPLKSAGAPCAEIAPTQRVDLPAGPAVTPIVQKSSEKIDTVSPKLTNKPLPINVPFAENVPTQQAKALSSPSVIPAGESKSLATQQVTNQPSESKQRSKMIEKPANLNSELGQNAQYRYLSTPTMPLFQSSSPYFTSGPSEGFPYPYPPVYSVSKLAHEFGSLYSPMQRPGVIQGPNNKNTLPFENNHKNVPEAQNIWSFEHNFPQLSYPLQPVNNLKISSKFENREALNQQNSQIIDPRLYPSSSFEQGAGRSEHSSYSGVKPTGLKSDFMGDTFTPHPQSFMPKSAFENPFSLNSYPGDLSISLPQFVGPYDHYNKPFEASGDFAANFMQNSGINYENKQLKHLPNSDHHVPKTVESQQYSNMFTHNYNDPLSDSSRKASSPQNFMYDTQTRQSSQSQSDQKIDVDPSNLIKAGLTFRYTPQLRSLSPLITSEGSARNIIPGSNSVMPSSVLRHNVNNRYVQVKNPNSWGMHSAYGFRPNCK